ncbi:hypothetical protein HUJ04_011045 [Dendroctonus ponderosae]|nr:hypothetical protein HUJ04_011045 [Dendroctonus ponderosae]KAH1021546.1 hypothetical protein HUJ04_011045 [Dendroctonus ponderosae]
MQFGVSRDLLDLMRLPSLNGKLARILYKAGVETVIELANRDVAYIENILCRAGPFESAKERDGESKTDTNDRNKFRTVWITGKEGLTEREAAQLLVNNARNYLVIEVGLKEAKWNSQSNPDKHDSTFQLRANEGTKETKLSSNRQLIIDASSKSSLSENAKNHNSVCSGDGNVVEGSVIGSAKEIYFGDCSENVVLATEDDAVVNGIETSFKTLSITPSKETEIVSTQAPIGLNISESSLFSSSGSLEKSKSEEQFTDSSFTLQLSDDQEIFTETIDEFNSQDDFETAIKNIDISHAIQKNCNYSVDQSDNITLSNYSGSSASDININVLGKRGRSSSGSSSEELFLEATPNKKCKNSKILTPFASTITKYSQLSLDNINSIKAPSELHIVDVGRSAVSLQLNLYCENVLDIERFYQKNGTIGDYNANEKSAEEAKRRASIKVLDLEMRTILCLARMETCGMSVSKKYLQNLSLLLKGEQTSIEKMSYSLAGRRFSFTSSADVSRVIGTYRGKKVSTRKQVLEQNEHPISKLVLLWRKINFTLTNMIYPLIRASEENRLYGSYVSHTATGRITMHEPNIQMVTKDFTIVNPLSKNNVVISCRSAFNAPTDYVLVSADYCQLELRILTYLSRDKVLSDIMRKPGDIFKSIAAKWNNTNEEMVDENMRQNAKQLCYGIIYGMGAKTLADQLEVSIEDAFSFMESFRNTYSGIKDFIKKTVDFCKENGYVETITGRRRLLPNIASPDSSISTYLCLIDSTKAFDRIRLEDVRNELLPQGNTPKQHGNGQAERQAVNTTVQGSAADIVKNAMITIDDKMEQVFKKSRFKPRLVLHLHDELIYEVPEKYIEKTVKVIKKGMENSVSAFGYFPVKVKAGKSWGQLYEYCK